MKTQWSSTELTDWQRLAVVRPDCVSNVLIVPDFWITLISILVKAGLSTFSPRNTSTCAIYQGKTLVMTRQHWTNLYHMNTTPVLSKEAANMTIDIHTAPMHGAHFHGPDSPHGKRGPTPGHSAPDWKTGVLQTMHHCQSEEATLSTSQGGLGNLALTNGTHRCGRTNHSSIQRRLQVLDGDCRQLHLLFLGILHETQEWSFKCPQAVESGHQKLFPTGPGQQDFTPEALEYIQSDNGGEFTSAHFRGQLQNNGVWYETSALDMLSTIANTMLEESKLPKYFWANAMTTAAYVTAWSLANGLNGGTPYEALFNRHVNSTLFWKFGSPAYALTPKDKWLGKFYPHAWKEIMIGYTHGQQAYKLLDLKHCTVFSSWHVQFNEEATLAPSETNPWNTHTTGDKWEGLTLACLLSKASSSTTPVNSKLDKDGKLTPKECKRHQDNNLCMFWRGASHFVDKCSKKTKAAKAHAVAAESAETSSKPASTSGATLKSKKKIVNSPQNLAKSESCIDSRCAHKEAQLNVSTLSDANSLTPLVTLLPYPLPQLHTLVDSGSTYCFLNLQFTNQHPLPIHTIDPITLWLFDGILNFVITQTMDLSIVFPTGDITVRGA